jgi:hypothetical protein
VKLKAYKNRCIIVNILLTLQYSLFFDTVVWNKIIVKTLALVLSQALRIYLQIDLVVDNSKMMDTGIVNHLYC